MNNAPKGRCDPVDFKYSIVFPADRTTSGDFYALLFGVLISSSLSAFTLR
jgi:hypothetical protein